MVEERRSDSGSGIGAKEILVLVLIVLVVILAIANSTKVKVDFLVGDIEMRLFLVIVGAAIVGWVIGWFTGRRRD